MAASIDSRSAPAKPVVGLLRHLQIVVVEADQRRSRASRRARSRRRGCAGWPTAAVDDQRCRAGSSARPWSACRSWRRCDCGPSARIGWPLPCLRRSLSMIARAEQEHEDQRGHHRAAGAERDVAEHVEERERAGKVGQPVEHRINLACRRRGAEPEYWRVSALTIGPIFEPSEPLTITASPARTAASTSRFERRGCLGIAAPAFRGKSLPQRAHQRAGAEHQIDGVVRDRRRRGRGAAAGPAGPSSSMSPSTAMRRPRGPTGAWPSSASAARIEAGIGVVAFVDQRGAAARQFERRRARRGRSAARARRAPARPAPGRRRRASPPPARRANSAPDGGPARRACR